MSSPPPPTPPSTPPPPNDDDKTDDIVWMALQRADARARGISIDDERELGWNHPAFAPFAKCQRERDDYEVATLGDVEEGVAKCPRCGCARVVLDSIQTRSADESATTFALCAACKHKWTQN